MNDNVLFLILIVGVIGVASLVTHLRNKKVLTVPVFDNIDSTLEIAELILTVIDPKEKIENRTRFVLELVDTVTEFAYSYSFSNENKEELALRLLDEVVQKLNDEVDGFSLELDESDIRLAKIIISESLKWLEKHVNLNEKA